MLATNPTLEGEATAMYLAERLTADVRLITRIARGIPVGGDLEYADEVTLVRAHAGPARVRGRARAVSNLVAELLLRLIKPVIAVLLGLLVFAVAVALGEPGSIALALLSWLSAAAFILLVQEGPLSTALDRSARSWRCSASAWRLQRAC